MAASQILVPYLPRPLLREILLDGSHPSDHLQVRRWDAVVLFVDISGFTALTELLSRYGSTGIEELSRLINRYLSRMVDLIEVQGGEIVHFNGDGLTAVFFAKEESLSKAIRRSSQAAETMLASRLEFKDMPTSIGPISLEMKIGIGAGTITTMQLGGYDNSWKWLFSGDALQQIASLELKTGTTALSNTARRKIYPQALAELPIKELTIPESAELEQRMKSFLPELMLRWINMGLTDWMAVLRPMTILFIQVHGLHTEQKNYRRHLQDLTIHVQELLSLHRGMLRQMVVDEKGTQFLCVFGVPPFAGSDDATRAVNFAFAAREKAQKNDLQLSIGIATGSVFAGLVGSASYREYTCIGDAVNLSARLMSHANPGQIICDATSYRQAVSMFSFNFLQPVRLKGKSGFIRLFEPQLGNKHRQPSLLMDVSMPLLERQAELDQITTLLDQTLKGQGEVVLIEGVSGSGKSRLLEALVQASRVRGMVGMLGLGQSVQRYTPYSAWRQILRGYFGIMDIEAHDEQRKRIQQIIEDVAPEHSERIPLFNDALELNFPENPLTKSLAPNLRIQNLALVINDLFRKWLQEQALVLLIEDIHWLDSLSWELLQLMARSLLLEQRPFLIVLTFRPRSSMQREIERLLELPSTHLLLKDLSYKGTEMLIAVHLGVLRRGLPKELVDFIHERSGGNPHFVLELLRNLRGNDVVTFTPDPAYPEDKLCLFNEVQALESIPSSAQGILLSRIDRLNPEQQLCLKAAAVVGPSFIFDQVYFMLNTLFHTSRDAVEQAMDDLLEVQLVTEDVTRHSGHYRFQSGLTQEVVYRNMIAEQRQQFHKSLLSWFEQTYASPEAHQSHLAVMVHHAHQAEEIYRERQYALQAGSQALHRYANAEAKMYFSRVLELLPDQAVEERYRTLLLRENIHDRIGDRQHQRADIELLQALVEQVSVTEWKIEVALREAQLAYAISDHDMQVLAATRVLTLAEMIGQLPSKAAAHLSIGRVLLKQGAYTTAREQFNLGLTLSQQAGAIDLQADVCRALGAVCAYLGDTLAAQRYTSQALSLYRAAGQRMGEGTILNNLGRFAQMSGEYDQCQHLFELALEIDRTLGIRVSEALTLTNLGILAMEKQLYQRAYAMTQASLRLCREIGSREIECMALDNLGDIARYLGDLPTAQITYYQALQISEATNNYRMTAEIKAGLALGCYWRSRFDQALTYAQESYKLASKIKTTFEIGLAAVVLAMIYTRQAEQVLAQEMWSTALDVWFAMRHQTRIAEAQLALALLEVSAATPEQLVERYQSELNTVLMRPLLGVSDVAQVYLHAHELLVLARDPRQYMVLEQARLWLDRQMAEVTDSSLRRSFMQIPSRQQLSKLVSHVEMRRE